MYDIGDVVDEYRTGRYYFLAAHTYSDLNCKNTWDNDNPYIYNRLTHNDNPYIYNRLMPH